MEVAAEVHDSNITPVTAPEGTSDNLSLRDAAKTLAGQRWKRDNPEPAPQAEEPIPVPEGASVEPAEALDAEPTEAIEPAEQLPPVEPPRSWTKEEKEEFASYPREAQEKIARREQERETALRRGQNEHAEKLKALTAREQAAEQARLQYEQALPALMQALQTQMQGEFSDIKTMEDVQRLANEDWPRYAKWDAAQKKVAAVMQEAQAAQMRQQQVQQQQWQEFAKTEDQKFIDAHPEFRDAAKLREAGELVLKTLTNSGMTREEAIQAYNTPAYRTAAAQEIMLKAALYDQAKAKASKPVQKPLPPVLRPGSGQERLDSGTLELKQLQKAFNSNPNARTAAALKLAQRRAQSR